jgi:2-polyprenyl-6-methoxyphenol hydroxylase-like FAD-dependent oxidoreductase
MEDGLMFEDNEHLPSPHLLRGKRSALVGGGPAGLTLTRLLQRNDVRVHVFERDVEARARLQGGSLDLHEKSGQLALDRCGLTGHFSTVACPEGQATCVIDKHGVRRAASAADDEEESRPEIDRGALRDLLLSSLDEGTVIWRSPPCAILPEADRHRLVFEHRQAELFDLVIGADGLRSKVRPLVTPIKSFYSGVTFIETRLSNVDDRHPKIARYVGPGSVLALGDNKGLLAQRNGDGSIRGYISRRIPEHWIRDNKIGVEGPAQTRERLLAWFPDWGPELLEMVRQSEDRFLPWPLYAFPPDRDWTTRPGLTILGDAAHVMPPFLGQGANMAMLDAVELTDHLLGGRFATLTETIEAFEKSMRARMAPLIRGSPETRIFCSRKMRRMTWWQRSSCRS